MWKLLAHKEGHMYDSLPSDDDIRSETGLFELKGIRMSWFAVEKSSYDPYLFDKRFGAPGKFRQLVENLRYDHSV